MKKVIIILAIVGIVAVAFSGCIGEKTPIPPKPKYIAQIVTVADATNMYPELFTRSAGWYDPQTLQGITQYTDSNLGVVNKAVTVLFVGKPIQKTIIGILPGSAKTEEYSIPFKGKNLEEYTDFQIQPNTNHIYIITIAFDLPQKQELWGSKDGKKVMKLEVYASKSEITFKDEIFASFDIIFTEPNTFTEGFS